MSVRLRAATRGDVPALAGLMEAFAAEARVGLPHDPAQVRVTLAGLIDAPLGYVSALDDGAPCGLLVGAAGPSPWFAGLLADEMAWWIAPERRGRWARAMLDDFETWARSVGAVAVGMGCLARDLGVFYERAGYARTECKHMKVLG